MAIPASAPFRMRNTRSSSSATNKGCCAAARGSPIRWSLDPPSAIGIFRSGGRSFPAFAAREMPRASTERGIRVDVLLDEDDGRPVLYEATFRSLHAEVKELPAVWLYDERGSRLYEEITRLPEYYLPRREGEILRARSGEIARLTQACTLVELGAGTAQNTRLLLAALDTAGTLERFVPLDLSEHPLRASAQAIATAYPRVFVHAIVGDFERHLGELQGRGPIGGGLQRQPGRDRGVRPQRSLRGQR